MFGKIKVNRGSLKYSSGGRDRCRYLSVLPVLTALVLVPGKLRRNIPFVSIQKEEKREELPWLGMRL